MTHRAALYSTLLPLLFLHVVCQSAAHIATGRTLEGALRLALSPTHLAATATPDDFPRLDPRAATLLNDLLDSVNSTRVGEHWQGSPESLQALQELISGGRALVATLQQQQQAQQQQLPAQRLEGPKTWMGSAERLLSTLQTGPSYPQLRRAVVAVLLELRLAAAKAWLREDDAAALQILVKLYDLHVTAASRKSAVEYYHFSKAAGTSVCVSSAAMGCTTFSVAEQHTCLIPEFGDGPRWINRKVHNSRCRRFVHGSSQCVTKLYTKLAKWGLRYNPRAVVVGCEERAQWLADRGFNFYASEYTLRGRGGNVTAPPALCSNFLNLAVLRAPRARLISHMRYVVRTTHDWMGERTAKFLFNMTLADWRRLLPAAFDNYYLRGLLGEDVFYRRTGNLTADEHLRAGRDVLSAMDVVLILEDPELVLQLGHTWGLGWNRTFLHAEGRSSSRVSREVVQIADQVVPKGPDAEELAAANALDEQLYDFAVLLSRLDAVVWAAAEGSGVPTPRSAAYLGPYPAKGFKGGSTGTGDRKPCGYVPAIYPKPPGPPLAPSPALRGAPSVPLAPRGVRGGTV